jgi:hypothetical protein
MFKHIVISFFALSIFCSNCTGQGINERFAELLFQKANTCEGMSVLVEKITLFDELVPAEDENELVPSEAGTPSSPKEWKRSVSSYRDLQRIVIGAEGKQMRLDAITYSLFDVDPLSNAWREAELVHDQQAWYFTESPKNPSKGIKRHQIKGGVIPQLSNSKWKHPFDVTITQSGSLMGDFGSSLAAREFYSVDEVARKDDGRTQITAYIDTGAAYKVTFNKDEEWLPEEVLFMKKNRTFEQVREEELRIAKGFRPPKPNLTKESLQDYRVYATNLTEWRKVDDDQWVPWATHISTEQLDGHQQNEIRFRDWKFGLDVDLSLLDEESFTESSIRKSVDFSAIRKVFDESK